MLPSTWPAVTGGVPGSGYQQQPGQRTGTPRHPCSIPLVKPLTRGHSLSLSPPPAAGPGDIYSRNDSVIPGSPEPRESPRLTHGPSPKRHWDAGRKEQPVREAGPENTSSPCLQHRQLRCLLILTPILQQHNRTDSSIWEPIPAPRDNAPTERFLTHFSINISCRATVGRSQGAFSNEMF